MRLLLIYTLSRLVEHDLLIRQTLILSKTRRAHELIDDTRFLGRRIELCVVVIIAVVMELTRARIDGCVGFGRVMRVGSV
jgi:hypothetical protein